MYFSFQKFPVQAVEEEEEEEEKEEEEKKIISQVFKQEKNEIFFLIKPV